MRYDFGDFLLDLILFFVAILLFLLIIQNILGAVIYFIGN